MTVDKLSPGTLCMIVDNGTFPTLWIDELGYRRIIRYLKPCTFCLIITHRPGSAIVLTSSGEVGYVNTLFLVRA